MVVTSSKLVTESYCSVISNVSLRSAIKRMRPTHRSDRCDHSPNRPHATDAGRRFGRRAADDPADYEPTFTLLYKHSSFSLMRAFSVLCVFGHYRLRAWGSKTMREREREIGILSSYTSRLRARLTPVQKEALGAVAQGVQSARFGLIKALSAAL